MRRFRRFGRHKRPTQWLVNSNFWGQTPIVAAAGVLQSAILIDCAPADTAVPTIERLTHLRTVGDCVIQSTDGTNADGFYTMGLYVDSAKTAGAGNFLDPTVAQDAERSNWLWLYTGVIASLGSSAGYNPWNLPNGGHMDIRVKRIMRPGDQLVFALKAKRAIQYNLNLRHLLSRVA